MKIITEEQINEFFKLLIDKTKDNLIPWNYKSYDRMYVYYFDTPHTTIALHQGFTGRGRLGSRCINITNKDQNMTHKIVCYNDEINQYRFDNLYRIVKDSTINKSSDTGYALDFALNELRTDF